jgi:hypothetical protein
MRQKTPSEVPPRSWLMLVHQLPPKPAYLRVKVWRRLQGLGAIAVKNSVYILPASEQAREDFQWLLKEIEKSGVTTSQMDHHISSFHSITTKALSDLGQLRFISTISTRFATTCTSTICTTCRYAMCTDPTTAMGSS